MKLAYNGKTKHHWAQHRAQAIALLPAKEKIELDNAQIMDTKQRTIFSLVGIMRGLVESSVSITMSPLLYP